MLKPDDSEVFETDAVEKKTVWIGDPAVDAEATDKVQWYETGEGAVIKPGEKASTIRYRSLYPREVLETARLAGIRRLPDGSIDPVMVGISAFECAKISLISVEGVSLTWDRYSGVRGLSDESIHLLDRMAIPDLSTDADRKAQKQVAPQGYEGLAGVRFMNWIGGLIQAISFRHKR